MKLFARVGVFLFSFIVALSAFAQDTCPNIDLRDDYNFGPVRNQKRLGWCYAYAITDMFSFYAKQRVSAFDVAMSLYREHPEYGIDTKPYITDISGGRADWTFASVIKNGMCAERKVSSQGNITSPSYRMVEDIVKAALALDRTEPQFSLEIRKMVLQNAWRLHVIFPSTSVEELILAFQKMVTQPRPFVSLVDDVCGERIALPNTKITVRRYPDSRMMIAALQERLNSRNPVVISYSGSSLKNVNYEGDANHNSSILGMRKTNDGKCEFLLRNSWGPVNKARYDRTLQPGYNNGYLWIPQVTMEKMTKYLYYFEPTE